MFGSIIKWVVEGITGPFFSWLNKKEDVSLEKFKVDGKVDMALLGAHVESLRVRRDVLLEAMKYRGIRMVQYGFMVPLMIWWNAIIAYCIIHPWYPEWPQVLALPSNLDYVAAGIIGFLFLTSKIDTWVRKT